jgi:hypothetical protein
MDRAIGEIALRLRSRKEPSVDIPVMALKKYLALATGAQGKPQER